MSNIHEEWQRVLEEQAAARRAKQEARPPTAAEKRAAIGEKFAAYFQKHHANQEEN